MTIEPAPSQWPAARHSIAFLLSHIFREMRHVLSRRLERHGVTPPQYGVMMLLHHVRQVSLTEIARHATKDTPTVCRIIDRLERRGFVRRDKDEVDRRCLLIGLTENGKSIAEACHSIGDELEHALLAGLTAREVRTLHALLGRVLDNAAKLIAPAEQTETFEEPE
jgi:DNA-binding MarR family transcriptional regulator